MVFKPSFEEALRKQTDNFSSLREHFVSETGYGARHGHAHPAGAGLAALSFQSVAAYKTRDEKAYGLILTHIGHEQGIKDKIKAHVENVLTGAPSVLAADPP